MGIKVLEKANWLPENSLAWGSKFPITANSNVLAVITFVLLGASLYYFARKPLGSEDDLRKR
jgi:hypothetical protein